MTSLIWCAVPCHEHMQDSLRLVASHMGLPVRLPHPFSHSLAARGVKCGLVRSSRRHRKARSRAPPWRAVASSTFSCRPRLRRPPRPAPPPRSPAARPSPAGTAPSPLPSAFRVYGLGFRLWGARVPQHRRARAQLGAKAGILRLACVARQRARWRMCHGLHA